MFNTFNPEDVRPHVDTGVCGKCRRKLEKGHRVTVAHIVDRVGNNARNLGEKGIYLFDEYELTHIDCRDPLLKKGLTNE